MGTWCKSVGLIFCCIRHLTGFSVALLMRLFNGVSVALWRLHTAECASADTEARCQHGERCCTSADMFCTGAGMFAWLALCSLFCSSLLICLWGYAQASLWSWGQVHTC